MNKHLQPITARANSIVKKDKDCGCNSPAKNYKKGYYKK